MRVRAGEWEKYIGKLSFARELLAHQTPTHTHRAVRMGASRPRSHAPAHFVRDIRCVANAHGIRNSLHFTLIQIIIIAPKLNIDIECMFAEIHDGISAYGVDHA